MLPLFWVTYTDSSTTDYSWTLRRACGTKMSKARPMGASPPHITVGKQASRLGLGFEKLLCGLLNLLPFSLSPVGKKGGIRCSCATTTTVWTRDRAAPTAQLMLGATHELGSCSALSKPRAKRKLERILNCPHSKSQYLCLVKPRLNPHD